MMCCQKRDHFSKLPPRSIWTVAAAFLSVPVAVAESRDDGRHLAEVATVNGISLGDSVSLSFEPLSTDSIQLEVKLATSAWVGIGFSKGTVTSMNGQGEGADIVVCASGDVLRYFVTGYSLGSGVSVAGASCTQASSETTLRFSRTLSASSSSEIDITPGTGQQVIWAFSEGDSIALGSHGGNKGSAIIDFSSGAVAEAESKSGTPLLYLHAISMLIAWAGLGPMGAIIASRLKVGKWFQVHRGLQSATVIATIIGFVAILIGTDYKHFDSWHANIGLLIVTLTILQPLNAVLRPHKPSEGEEKSNNRKAWEMLHKVLGWLLVLAGLCNAIGGVLHVRELSYDDTLFGVTLSLFLLFYVPYIVVAVFSCVWPNRVGSYLHLVDAPVEKDDLPDEDQQQ